MGTLTWIFADYPAALRWCLESLALAKTTDPAIAASVAHTLGVIAASRNDIARGRELVAQSVEELRRLPRSGPALLLPVALGFGRYPGAVADRLFLDQTFVTARRVMPELAVAYALNDSAVVARNAGDAVFAHAQLQESLATFRHPETSSGLPRRWDCSGSWSSDDSEHELARELLEESLAIRMSANDARGIGVARLALSAAAAAEGDAERAWSQAQQALELFERTDDGPGRSAVTCSSATWPPMPAGSCRPGSSSSSPWRGGASSSPIRRGVRARSSSWPESSGRWGNPRGLPRRWRRRARSAVTTMTASPSSTAARRLTPSATMR